MMLMLNVLMMSNAMFLGKMLSKHTCLILIYVKKRYLNSFIISYVMCTLPKYPHYLFVMTLYVHVVCVTYLTFNKHVYTWRINLLEYNCYFI